MQPQSANPLTAARSPKPTKRGYDPGGEQLAPQTPPPLPATAQTASLPHDQAKPNDTHAPNARTTVRTSGDHHQQIEPAHRADKNFGQSQQMASRNKPDVQGVSSPLSAGYVSFWLVCGLAAVSYLGVLFAKPELLADVLNDLEFTPQQNNQGQRATARADSLTKSNHEKPDPNVAKIDDVQVATPPANITRERKATTATIPPKNKTKTALVVAEINDDKTPENSTANKIVISETSTPTVPKIINRTGQDQVKHNDTTTPPKPPSLEPQTVDLRSTLNSASKNQKTPAPRQEDSQPLEANKISTIEAPKNSDPSANEASPVLLPVRKGAVPQEYLAAMEAKKSINEIRQKEDRKVALSNFQTTTSYDNITPVAPSQPESGFGNAIVTRADTSTSLAVQLATGPSVDSLRLSWSLLSDNHAAVLANLTPRYVSRSDNGREPTFELIAGPLATTNDAEAICNRVRARGIPCRVSSFVGNAL